ncbi:MAG: phosphoenolpyruvate carboxykinase (ATP) [Breznakibacter sp.]
MIKSATHDAEMLVFKKINQTFRNLSPGQLTQMAVEGNHGQIADNGALVCDTGEFKGRSPKDKYVVKDATTADSIWWGNVNQPYAPDDFESLLTDMAEWLQGKNVYVRDVYACAALKYQMNLRIVTQYPWQDLFVHNLFLRPSPAEVQLFETEWLVLALPDFRATPVKHHTRQHNFTVLNFSKKTILIGGSGYTGEIKKSVFTALNYTLPHRQNVLPMHCSANMDDHGNTAIFFGLSGTGKTTLSTDTERHLIGDDEHGWDSHSVFNFEGGCYAKCVDLTPEKEPQIYSAIRDGALVENTVFHPGTRSIDFSDTSKTENTRAAYPLHYIANARIPSIGGIPRHVFFLTCDAFGVLPPISQLSVGQAMFHFISGYTAKVAGTEMGVIEPKATFSACFGEPFLPLHPTEYARLLGEKLKQHQSTVWLINTGWSGGSYGIGHRIKLAYTRAMIRAVLNGTLQMAGFALHPIFGLNMPTSCLGVPDEILNPVAAWRDKAAYEQTARKLAQLFTKNFAQYKNFANDEILSGTMEVG